TVASISRKEAMRLALSALLAILAFAPGCSSDDNPMGVPAPRDSVANYRVTFTSTWSAATHPADFPGNAHFSGLIGATHSDQVVFWRGGALASPGIQAMAELGSKIPLSDEITAAMGAGSARYLLSGEGIRPSPGQVSLDLQVSDTHPLVTL